jgi:AcrR family transcriptional regulator
MATHAATHRPAARHKAVSPAFLAEELRDAAVKRFADEGAEHTSLESVARDVGVTKQAILHIYGSKEGLLDAVLSHLVLSWLDLLPRLIISKDQEAVSDAMMELAVRNLGHPEYARYGLREKLSRSAPESVKGPVTRYWEGLAAELVRRGQREGLVAKEVDPHTWGLCAVNLLLATFAFGDPKQTPARRARELKEVARILGVSLRHGA